VVAVVGALAVYEVHVAAGAACFALRARMGGGAYRPGACALAAKSCRRFAATMTLENAGREARCLNSAGNRLG
jgi:hypothetical protein